MSDLERFFKEHSHLFEYLRKNNLNIYTYIDDYSFNEKIYIEFKSKYNNKKYKTMDQFSKELYKNLTDYYTTTTQIFLHFILRILAQIENEIIQDIQKTNRIFIFDSELPLKTWKNCIEKLQERY
jgi:hypothetical protein